MTFKLVLVIDRLTNPHAGTEGQLLLLIDQLCQRGLELHLLVLAPSAWLQNNPLPCPVTVLGSSSIKNPLNWLKLWRIARQLRRQGFKLAHVFFNDASVLCPPTFRLAGIATIISRRDMGFWYNRLYRAVLPVTGRCVTRALTNSQAVADITHQVEKIPAANIHVIYNGCYWQPGSGAVVEPLTSIKASGAFVAGIVANIRPIKRMQDAIAAVAQLQARFPQLHLVIIGTGDSASLQQLADKLEVGQKVHFLGGRPDVANCLRYLDVGLLCSESEGFSNAIVEYQFAGLPVICSRTGGNPEAVTPGETGFLFPVGDVASLTDALAQLLQQPELAERMGARARELAQQRYSVQAMVDKHIAFYQSLIESRT